jgi:hypothetical protein
MLKLDTSTFVGKKFNRWTILSFAFVKEYPCGTRRNYWKCQCECGNVRDLDQSLLIHFRTHSCGCYHSEQTIKRNTTHGKAHTPEYQVWAGAIARCYNEKKKAYPYYGGRGITVCAGWRNSFEKFYADMGPRPTPKHTLERKDNDGNYSKKNCVWDTRLAQARNTRQVKRYTFNGKTLCLTEWAEELGVPHSSLESRIHKHGWSVERALSTPCLGVGSNWKTYKNP